jgi:hypothetical protein
VLQWLATVDVAQDKTPLKIMSQTPSFDASVQLEQRAVTGVVVAGQRS